MPSYCVSPERLCYLFTVYFYFMLLIYCLFLFHSFVLDLEDIGADKYTKYGFLINY